MEKKLRLFCHLVPLVLFALSVLSLIIGSFTLGGTWDKISAAFLYPFMPCAVLGGLIGAVLDIKAMLKKEGIVKNLLLLLLALCLILLGVWFLLLHQAFS